MRLPNSVPSCFASIRPYIGGSSSDPNCKMIVTANSEGAFSFSSMILPPSQRSTQLLTPHTQDTKA